MLQKTRAARLFARLLASCVVQVTALTVFASSSSVAKVAAPALLRLEDPSSRSSVSSAFQAQVQHAQQNLFLLSTDEDGNIFSLDSRLDVIFEGDESDCAKHTDDVAFEAETNTVNADGDFIQLC
eukprot:6196407-Pleurochrysis_carterae.AAC.1